jgi:septum formation protein
MNPFAFTPILLASASPRRSELLSQLGVPHAVLSVDADESPLAGESAQQLVTRLAHAKAREGLRRDGGARPVLGADTVVVVDAVVCGKPADQADAMRMLALLAGRRHRVLTAVAIASGPDAQVLAALSCTDVTMRAISTAEAAAYWETGEPAGKAGGYAIQGRGALFIEHISGSYSGVMGLPLYETAQLLQAVQHGVNR